MLDCTPVAQLCDRASDEQQKQPFIFNYWFDDWLTAAAGFKKWLRSVFRLKETNIEAKVFLNRL